MNVGYEVLSILGAAILLGMAVLGWYFKSILAQLTEIRLEMVKLVTEHGLQTKVLDSHEADIRLLRERSHEFGNAVNGLPLVYEKVDKLEEELNKINLDIARL